MPFARSLLALLFLITGLETALAASVDEALGLLKDRKYSEALQLLKPLADSGNADAQFHAGSLLASGLVPGGDPVAARNNGIELIKKSANQKQPEALQALSHMYLSGTGVPKDEKNGMGLLREAAELGEPLAQYELGRFYRDGQHVPRNRNEALRWLKESADQEFPPAMHELAALDASGPTKNPQAAFGDYKKAAEHGYLPAMRELGIGYHRGIGTTRNDLEAVKWFERAAAQRDSEAQYQLAMLYRLGEGVKKDPATAERLLQDAAKEGHAGAKAALVQVVAAPSKKKSESAPATKPAVAAP